jgi:hypothetical protein
MIMQCLLSLSEINIFYCLLFYCLLFTDNYSIAFSLSSCTLPPVIEGMLFETAVCFSRASRPYRYSLYAPFYKLINTQTGRCALTPPIVASLLLS